MQFKRQMMRHQPFRPTRMRHGPSIAPASCFCLVCPVAHSRHCRTFHGAFCEPSKTPVARDCVVELVGLEPTTKVLWNMVRVRPTPLVGHPMQIAGRFAVLLDFPGFLILESTTRV